MDNIRDNVSQVIGEAVNHYILGRGKFVIMKCLWYLDGLDSGTATNSLPVEGRGKGKKNK
jgi:hypothetical protein